MTKIIPAPNFVQTAFGLTSQNPLARMMAGFTGFAIAATLILVTAIPVQADRAADHVADHLAGACVMSLDGGSAPCVTD